MLKIIAKGYFTEMRSSVGKDKRKIIGYIWLVYWFTMLPLMLGYFVSAARTGMFFAAMLPFAWCLVQSGLCPLRLPEMLFFCPMDVSMRRRYIRDVCLFRTGLHTAVGILGALATLPAGNDWSGAFGMSLNVCLLSIVGIFTQGDEHTHVGRAAARCVGVGLGFILQIIYVEAAADGGLLRQAHWEQAVIGALQALFLLIALKYRTCWRSMQEEAICYEKVRSGQSEENTVTIHGTGMSWTAHSERT